MVIRLAAGNRYRLCSPVWRFWTNKSDVYFGARMALGFYKVSLHESGQWISALTKESGSAFSSGDRRHRSWQRPGEFRPGWTQGPGLIFPFVPWPTFELSDDVPTDVVWVSCPSPGTNVQVVVLFSSAGSDPDEIHQVSQPGDLVVGSMVLANGETVWLQARVIPMTADAARGIQSVGKEFEGFKGNPKWAWGMWVTTDQVHGEPLIVSVPVGPHHFGINATG